MNVLIIDDDPAVREMLVQLFERNHFFAYGAANGVAAFDALRLRPVNAVVCDIRMPQLDGQGFYEQLEELFPNVASRVVFLTGELDTATTDFLRKTGQPFFQKPIEPQRLVESVRTMVVQRQSAGYAIPGPDID